jgi:peroxiredoxin
MAQLRQDYQEFTGRSAEVIAVGPEGARKFAAWWHKNEMPFVGIADPEHTVAGLYRQQTRLLKLGRMPALMVVDRNGMLRYEHHGDSMADIPGNAFILSLLDRLNQE